MRSINKDLWGGSGEALVWFIFMHFPHNIPKITLKNCFVSTSVLHDHLPLTPAACMMLSPHDATQSRLTELQQLAGRAVYAGTPPCSQAVSQVWNIQMHYGAGEKKGRQIHSRVNRMVVGPVAEKHLYTGPHVCTFLITRECWGLSKMPISNSWFGRGERNLSVSKISWHRASLVHVNSQL